MGIRVGVNSATKPWAGVLGVVAVAGLALLPRAAAAQTPAAQQEQVDPLALLGLEVTITRDLTEFNDDGTMTFSGDVDIDALPEWRLQADRVVVTVPEDPNAPGADYYFEATGNVALAAGEVQLTGTRMTGWMRAGTGTIENAFGLGPGGVYFRGDQIAQLEPGVFHIEQGVVTPCTQTLPIWEFGASTFDLYANDHVTMKWPRFKIKGVPVFVLPALYYPIDEDRRSSGLLLPGIGNSSRKGFMYSQPVFWAINRSQDATFTYDYYSQAGSGFSAEYRHALTPTALGNARFFWLQGSSFTDEEIAAGADQVIGGWTFDGSHLQSLPRGWRVNANAAFFSSKEFIQGFEDNFNRFLRRNSQAGVFLTRTWSSYTLNIVADHNETYFGNVDSVVRRRTPEVEFRVRRKEIVEPLFFDFEGSYAGLLREERSPELDPLGGRYQRLDAFPEVSLAFTQIPWLTFNPFLQWRSTYYSQRTERDGMFEPDPILRNVYSTGIQVIGPSIFRIFDKPTSNYSPRYKHVLEPRFTWGRLAELEQDDFTRRDIIQFDEIDRYGGDRHFARLSLINRFLAKRFANPNAEQRTVWEVFSVELARDFDLREKDPEQLYPTIPFPWSITARVTPTRAINFSGRIGFTPTWRPGSFSLTGSARPADGSTVGITWFRSARGSPDEEDPSIVDVTSSDRLTGSGRYNIFRSVITLTGNLTWDVTKRVLQAYAIGATWNTQCCSIGGQLRQTNFSFRDELQFSVLVELLNVGSLGFGGQQR